MTEIRNRIVSDNLPLVRARELLPNPRNWRKHPRHQVEALTETLTGTGWVQRVLVNQRTGYILDGHARAQIAAAADTTVPVEYVDLSEAEEARVLATLDPLTGMAMVDAEQLEALLRDVEFTTPALSDLLEEQRQLAERVAFRDAAEAEADGQADPGRTGLNEWKAGGFVKVVIAAADAGLVERALTKAGTARRGEALTALCRAYLGENEGDDGGQAG